MILTSLTLQDFRSYTKKTIMLSATRTLFVGANATGKTNIIEAITLLATGKSFRARIDREVIRWGSPLSVVRCQVSEKEENTKLELYITQGDIEGKRAPLKKYTVNGVSRRVIDFVGHVRTVLFWPEDLEIITDSPSLRRKYLDTVLVQTDREYRRSLISYERGVRQRNKLLDLINQGRAERKQLLFWDQLLIRAGCYITEKRAAYITFVNSTILSDHHFLVTYDKSVISEVRLAQYKDEEVASKSTLVGPHRDDFVLLGREHGPQKTHEYRDLRAFGSRGEQRLAVLWLKLAELSYIEEETGSRPILLLDDIFSELDEGHRELVGIVTSQQQTIITSADLESVPFDIRERATIIRL